jgi:hypothetical protein
MTEKTRHTRGFHPQPHSCMYRHLRSDPVLKEKQRGGHQHTERATARAGPNVVMLLHPNRPPSNTKNTKSEANQHTRASPLSPLDASHVRGDLQPTTQHASPVYEDLQPATWLHAPDSFQELLPRWQEEVPRPPRIATSRWTTTLDRDQRVAFPTHTKPQPSPPAERPKNVASAVLRRCTAPGWFSHAGTTRRDLLLA